ncbi:MAG TPA: hypothetical protein VNT75_31005, partial [Symbiobacteriaceae bacterium]|nr:hypothetical protein [Symbiobacteriaceae bacterium]
MLHLILGLLAFALSLLAVLPPPHTYFWMLSIPVKEWGWVLALLCLPLLWPGALTTWAAGAGALLALAAIVLFLVPVLQAAGTARRLAAGAGGAAVPGGRPAPFVWKDLLLGVRAPRVPVQTVTYATHDGVALKMDLTRPAATPAPAVLVIHGGAWRSGDRKQLPALNRYLTARG